MKTYQIIIVLAILGVALYLYCNSSKKEYMGDLPNEINKLLDESAEQTYYGETNTEDDSEDSNDNDNGKNNDVNSMTSVDSDSLLGDSLTSITNNSAPVPVSKNGASSPVSAPVPVSKNGASGPVGVASNVVANNKNIEGVVTETKNKLHNEHDYVFNSVGNKHCTVDNTSDNADEYVRKLLIEGQPWCSNNKCGDKSVIRDYRKDFFNFRNQIWDNSRQNDMTAKVARLYLEGNTELTGRVKGRKVSDIYDELTTHQIIRDKNCVKKEDFDDTLHHGYFNAQGVNERQLTRDNWMYSKDSTPANKVIDNGLNGFDPAGYTQSHVSVGQSYENNN